MREVMYNLNVVGVDSGTPSAETLSSERYFVEI